MQNNEANVTTTPPIVTHEGDTTKVTTTVTTTIDGDTPSDTGANQADGHVLSAGATSADYEKIDQQVAAAKDAKAKEADKPTDASADTTSKDTPSEAASDVNEESLSVGPYLVNTVDDDHQQRVAAIIDNALSNCGVDRKKLIEALKEETLQDSSNLFAAAVEILYRASQAKPSMPPGVVAKERGRITIRSSVQPSNLAKTVILVGTGDGSLRALFHTTSGKSNPDILIKDAPDANAEPLIAAAVDWLSIPTV